MFLKKIYSAGIFVQTFFVLVFLSLLITTESPELRISDKALNLIPLFSELSRIGHENTIILKIAGSLIFIVTAYLFNYLNIKHDLLPRQNTLLVVVFSTLLLANPSYSGILLQGIVTLLLYMLLYYMYSIFNENQPYARILTAGIIISAISLIIPQTIVYIIFVWLGFFTYRIGNWREWVISVIGLVVPYIYYVSWLFLTDKLNSTWFDYITYFQSFRPVKYSLNMPEFITMGFIALLLIINSLRFLNEAGDKVIAIRRKMWLIFHFMWVSLLVMVISGAALVIWIPAFLLAAALFVSHNVINSRKTLTTDLLISGFLITILLIRLLN